MNIILDKYLNNANINNVKNPLLKDQYCTLYNTRKHEYYNNTYNGEKIATLIKNTSGTVPLFINVDTILNTCNCITFILYYISDINKFYHYLQCLFVSKNNAQLSAPNWLVRIYMDTSVYSLVEDCKKFLKNEIIPHQLQNDEFASFENHKQIIEYFENIINSSNVEIYTFNCEWDNISKTRSFRFLPLIDVDTNIVAMREADGILTNLDCHNLKIFETTDWLFYFIELFSKTNKTLYDAYSPWLKLYKMFIDPKFFLQKQCYKDLLAGTLATRVKFNPEYYYSTVTILSTRINKFINEQLPIINLDDLEKIYASIDKYGYQKDELLTITIMYLNIGFDEILLLDLFKDLVCTIDFKSFPTTFAPIESIFLKINDTGIVNQNINFVKVLYQKYLNYDLDIKNYEHFQNIINIRTTKFLYYNGQLQGILSLININ